MTRVSLLAIAVALLVSPSLATVSQVVEVDGDSVTVRDIIPPEATSGVGEDVLERALLTSLRPGERRVMTPAEINLRLADLGIDPRAYGWSWQQSVTIARRSQVISAGDLVAAGEQGIRSHLSLLPGDQAVITPASEPRSLLAPVGEITVEALIRPPKLPGGLWMAEVTITDGAGWSVTCTLRYRVRITGGVLVTRRPIARHESLRDSDVAIEVRDLSRLRGDPSRAAAQLAGRRAARAVSAGTIVTGDWLEPIPAVRRGDAFTAVAHAGGVSASTLVRALSDGSPGDVIRARTDRDTSGISVRVSGPGRGEVVVPS